MPKLRDEMTHDEMRLEWPVWRDMLISALELQRPPNRDWTEEEKYMTLMMHGGRNIRDTASFTAPVSGELETGCGDGVPKFTNLITRCNWTYRARDPTMEITVLRSMMQKEDESVREFLEKARRQISLCGYNTGAERDRELVMLLKQNTIDAINISKHGIGQNLEQMEALAVNLESIRQREQRQATQDKEKAQKQEVDIHAVMDKYASWSKTTQPVTPQQLSRPQQYPRQQQSNYGDNRQQTRNRSDCDRCGRQGGHEEGWKCRAASMECFKCGRTGHLAVKCRQSGIKQEPTGGQKGRVNQVSSRGSDAQERDADQWNN
jgi:Zinc knuckle